MKLNKQTHLPKWQDGCAGVGIQIGFPRAEERSKCIKCSAPPCCSVPLRVDGEPKAPWELDDHLCLKSWTSSIGVSLQLSVGVMKPAHRLKVSSGECRKVKNPTLRHENNRSREDVMNAKGKR